MILHPSVKKLIAMALEEDIAGGDVTADAIAATTKARAKLIAREACVLSGLELVPGILAEAGAQVDFVAHGKNGDRVAPGATVLEFSGNARDLLTLERTILNFLQRTCGLATKAAEYKAAVRDFPRVRVVDTRKTLPGWRQLDKQAIRDGGLLNHRHNLSSGVLVKENHIRAAGGISAIVSTLRRQAPHSHVIEVEVTNVAEAFEAIESGATALLLDNFSPSDLMEAVRQIRAKAPKVFLEASGGIHLGNLAAYAATDVDCVSIGALTHSAPAANLSLLFEQFS